MEMKTYAKLILALTAAVLLVAGLAMTATVQTAKATPQFAQQTGKACGYCHVNAAGGGKLKAAGEKFKKNGNKL
jgi:glucose uptake protein GlcU